MVEGAVDDESEVAAEPLSLDEVLGVGDDGTVADDDSLRLAGSACGEKDVGSAFRHGAAFESSADILIAGLGDVLLKGYGYAASEVDGEVGDQEVGGLGGAEGNERRGGESLFLDALPELGVGEALVATDDGQLVGLALCVLG